MIASHSASTLHIDVGVGHERRPFPRHVCSCFSEEWCILRLEVAAPACAFPPLPFLRATLEEPVAVVTLFEIDDPDAGAKDGADTLDKLTRIWDGNSASLWPPNCRAYTVSTACSADRGLVGRKA